MKFVADKKMSSSKRTVLITGCSDGGLDPTLAIAFHQVGIHLYVTAQNLSKYDAGRIFSIEKLILDAQSDSLITTCVKKLSSLDILVKDTGAAYSMPVSDLSSGCTEFFRS